MKGTMIFRRSGDLGKENAGKENEWETKEYLTLFDPILELGQAMNVHLPFRHS